MTVSSPTISLAQPQMLQRWVSQTPGLSRPAKLLGHLMRAAESTHGVSHTVFVQHLLMTWLPKATASRSKVELGELSFLELFETLLVYYSIPLTGRHVFMPVFKKLANIGSDHPLLFRSVEELKQTLGKSHPEKLAKLLPAKAAIAMSAMIAGAAGWEYALTFLKNIVTLKAFKKDSFSDILNLTEGTTRKPIDSPVMAKAKKRIKQALTVAAGVFLAAVALATLGPKSKALQRFSEKFLKTFDFGFNRYLHNGKEKMALGLTKNQNRFFIASAFIAYMDAVRDKLEFMEVFTRLLVTMSYLAFGSGVMEQLTVKLLKKRIPPSLLESKTTAWGKTLHLKSSETLRSELIKSLAEKHKGLTTEAIEKLAKQEYWKMLPTKIKLFFIPELIGLGFAGFGNAFLARFWTAFRFEHDKGGVRQKGMYTMWDFVQETAQQFKDWLKGKPPQPVDLINTGFQNLHGGWIVPQSSPDTFEGFLAQASQERLLRKR